MSNTWDKLIYVKNKLKILLGNPVLQAVQSDLDAIPLAIEISLLQYWTALPYKYLQPLEVDVNNSGEVYVPIQTLKNSAFGTGTDANKSSYYLGILGINEAPYQMRNLTSYLLGRAVINNPYLNPKSGRIDLNNIILYNTERDILTGAFVYRHDTVNDQMIYTIPVGYMQYTLIHGFGFYDPTLAYIPEHYLQMFAKMTAVEFLDMIISGRSSVKLEGDFTIDSEYIKSRRNELKEEVAKEIRLISPMPILRG